MYYKFSDTFNLMQLKMQSLQNVIFNCILI